MTTFEIGSQNAASIQNVGGDLTIGELHVEAVWSAAEVRQELERLREELARAALPLERRAAAEEAVGAAAAEAGLPVPSRGRIAELLREATTVVDDAGGLATAGAGVVEGLRRTATLLGPAGKTLLALLPLL
jgi:hypothetical protein